METLGAILGAFLLLGEQELSPKFSLCHFLAIMTLYLHVKNFFEKTGNRQADRWRTKKPYDSPPPAKSGVICVCFVLDSTCLWALEF